MGFSSCHVGKIYLSEDLLLKFLQFSGGRIKSIRLAEGYGQVAVTIEHPEMPEVIEGSYIPVVNPAYIKYTDTLGNSVSVRQPLEEGKWTDQNSRR